MNKLILIGNGFDMAHGLPTSYNNFINSFWSNLKSNYENDTIKEIVHVNKEYDGFFDFSIKAENFEDFWKNIQNYAVDRGHMVSDYALFKDSGYFHPIFKFENNFFKKINIKRGIEGWVDIENEYYKELKRIVKQQKIKVRSRQETSDELSSRKKGEVLKLNKEFEQVKKLLENYLSQKIIEEYDFNECIEPKYFLEMYNILRPISIFNNESKINEEFAFMEDIDEIEKMFNIEKATSINNSISYLLTFNYTSTVSSYHQKLFKDDKITTKINYIHGEVRSKENQIIFGFGDEIDEDYEKIENIGDNEYLKNFKSFKYLNTNRYDSLLNFIYGGKFQVVILGHSCGLSDRVLLNTIFEHENCRSIKVFYHQKENGEDNYTDIVQNISRHFTDKESMRDKLVNKTLCKPLPQEVRFKKRT